MKDKVNSSLIPLQVIFRVKKPSEELLQPPKGKDGRTQGAQRGLFYPALLPARPKPLARDLNAKCRLFLRLLIYKHVQRLALGWQRARTELKGHSRPQGQGKGAEEGDVSLSQDRKSVV